MKKSNKLTPTKFRALKEWIKQTSACRVGKIAGFRGTGLLRRLNPLQVIHLTKKYRSLLAHKSRIARDRVNMLNAVRDADIWHVECTEQIGRTLVKYINYAYRARQMGRKDV